MSAAEHTEPFMPCPVTGPERAAGAPRAREGGPEHPKLLWPGERAQEKLGLKG